MLESILQDFSFMRPRCIRKSFTTNSTGSFLMCRKDRSSAWCYTTMGCVSSKIIGNSISTRENFNGRKFRKRASNVIEEIILSNSRNTRDQFLALLCTSSSCGRRIAEASESEEPAKMPETVGSASPSVNIEIMNSWDLLAGIDDDALETNTRCDVKKVKSFRTVEDYDELVAIAESKNGAGDQRSKQEESIAVAAAPASGDGGGRGWKRRQRAKELAELNIHHGGGAFEFSKSGSLKEWLQRGGQIFSPGSYVTPKFGNAAAANSGLDGRGGGGDAAVFDPELVAQLEHAMLQLSADEEAVLDGIVRSLQQESEEASGC